MLPVVAVFIFVIIIFFASSNPETRERLLLVSGIVILAAATLYMLTSGAHVGSGELNETVVEKASNVSNTVNEIIEKMNISSNINNIENNK